jgi:hypothetical protein
MTWDDVCKIGLAFPGVEVSTSYGTPALKVKGKFLTRLRPEDDSVVLVDVPHEEREMLLETDPDVFWFTDHYRDYPAVLARLRPLAPETFESFLERRWRNVAPKALVKAYDAPSPTGGR